MSNFEIHKGIADKEYFAKGDIFNDKFKEPIDLHRELVVSNSLIARTFKRGLYNVLQESEVKISDELKEIFRLGSAFHCYVLEHREFHKRYYVRDFIDEAKELQGLERVGIEDFKFISMCYVKITKMYPQIISNDKNEVVITGEIDGVPVKCKIDCLIIDKGEVRIIDLKGVWYSFFSKYVSPKGDRLGLRKSLCDNHYDIQSFFYSKVVGELLKQRGLHGQPIFEFLVCSKDEKSFDVQMFRVGSEMNSTGEQKFEAVWDDIRDFYLDGKSSVQNFINL